MFFGGSGERQGEIKCCSHGVIATVIHLSQKWAEQDLDKWVLKDIKVSVHLVQLLECY